MQVDLSTPSAVTATLRRNLMEFFDDNHKEFVPGGGTVIYLDSQDPLKMTLGVVYTFSHNGEISYPHIFWACIKTGGSPASLLLHGPAPDLTSVLTHCASCVQHGTAKIRLSPAML